MHTSSVNAWRNDRLASPDFQMHRKCGLCSENPLRNLALPTSTATRLRKKCSCRTGVYTCWCLLVMFSQVILVRVHALRSDFYAGFFLMCSVAFICMHRVLSFASRGDCDAFPPDGFVISLSCCFMYWFPLHRWIGWPRNSRLFAAFTRG